jgi:hypothetical protein
MTAAAQSGTITSSDPPTSVPLNPGSVTPTISMGCLSIDVRAAHWEAASNDGITGSFLKYFAQDTMD